MKISGDNSKEVEIKIFVVVVFFKTHGANLKKYGQYFQVATDPYISWPYAAKDIQYYFLCTRRVINKTGPLSLAFQSNNNPLTPKSAKYPNSRKIFHFIL